MNDLTTALTAQPFGKDDVQYHQEEVLYKGFLEIRRLHLSHRLHGGGMSPVITRELCLHHPAVAVLPYDPQLDVVVMIQQFRVGAHASQSPWLLEIVAGITDKDHESLTDVAIRETEEESGLKVINLECICEYFVSPGASNEKLTLYCGQVDATSAGGIYGCGDEHEDILVQAIAVKDAFTLLHEGKINNATSIIALQWLQLHYATLRERWLRSTS
jgi:ADP-ribose pyrophosphatase